MPDVIVKAHVDTFMKSDDSSDALNAIGGLGESKFAGLSATLVSESEFASLSSGFLLKSEFAGLSSTFSQGSLPTVDFAGLSATLLPKLEFAGLSSNFTNLSASNVSNPTEFRRNIQTSKVPTGPYATALEASINGATFGEPYYNSNYDLKVLRTPVSSIAFLGDSVTSMTGATLPESSSYPVWTRSLGRSKWDYARDNNGNNFTFAVGGSRSDQLTMFLSAISASPANIVFIGWGINDVQQTGGTVQSLLTSSAYAIDVLRRAGKFVVQATVIPPLTSTNVATAQKWLTANQAIREQCSAYNVPVCEWANVLSLSAGAVSGYNIYYRDQLHPNSWGASMMGRVAFRTLSSFVNYSIDNNTKPITAYTQNENLSAVGSANPTNWSIFPATGGSITARPVSSTSTGNYWTVEFYKGTSGPSSPFSMSNSVNNIAPVSSIYVEGYAEFEVLSGGAIVEARFLRFPGNALVIADNYAATVSASFIPSDGRVALRTPPYVPPSDTSLLYPSVIITPDSGNAVVRFKSVGVRQIS